MKTKLCFLLLPLSLCACANLSNTNSVPAPESYSLAVNSQNHIATKHRKATPMVAELQNTKVSAKKSRSGLVGLAAINAANKKSQRQPNSNGYLNSIMTFNFMPGVLYQIYCMPLSVTDIQFQSNEHIVSVAAGDTMRWQVSKTYSGSGFSKQEHLLVKPVEEDLDNGLVITTDQRTYHLMLHSTPKTYMASVTWRYPSSDGLFENISDDNEPASVDFAVDVNKLDMKYHVNLVKRSGRPDWFPLMVFSNGSKTFIKFPSNIQEAPTLFVGSSLKNQQLVNYRVSGNFYIVDSVISKAQLRSGQYDQYVVQIEHY